MFPTQLITKQMIDGNRSPSAGEKCQGHEGKRQDISVIPVGLLDWAQPGDGQAQRKGSREEPYEKGNATKEFGKDSDRADGCRYPILFFPVVESFLEPTSAKSKRGVVVIRGRKCDRQT